MDKKSRNFIIAQHNNAVLNINELENTCANYKVTDDKSKAQFGNFCIALKGYRLVADATEAILINEDIVKGKDGFFYEKIEYCCPFYEKAKDTVKVPENSDKGSDFDKDNKENHE